MNLREEGREILDTVYHLQRDIEESLREIGGVAEDAQMHAEESVAGTEKLHEKVDRISDEISLISARTNALLKYFQIEDPPKTWAKKT